MREVGAPPRVEDPRLAAALSRLWKEVANLPGDPAAYRVVEALAGRTGFDFQRKDKATGRWTKVWNVDRAGLDDRRCAAIYESTSGQVIGTVNLVTVDYATKIEDSDNAVTTGSSWRFTCPKGKAGLYHITATILFVALTAAATRVFIVISKNGSLALTGDRNSELVNEYPGRIASGLIRLAEGDYLDVGARQQTGANQSLDTTPGWNRVNIHRLIGY